MTATTLSPSLARTADTSTSVPAARRGTRPSALPLALALFAEAAIGLAMAVALSSVAGTMDETAAIGLRLAAGLSLVAAVAAWALGRRGAMRRRRGSYVAAAILQVAITVGVAALGLSVDDPMLLAALLPIPLLSFGALCLPTVREALHQG